MAHLPAAVPFVLLAALHAQEPRPSRSLRFASVVVAGPQEVVSCMTNYQRSFAPGPDGSMFLLVARCKWPDPARAKEPKASVELWRSSDGCLTWRQVAELPTPVANDGAIVPLDRGRRLSVCWTGQRDAPFSSVWHQEFDAVAGEFVGQPFELAHGSAEQRQYFAYDTDQTADGTLVAAIGNHRENEAPWTSGWSTGLRWRPSGSTEWRPIVQVNPGEYGLRGQVQVQGSLAHVTYRTKGWDPILALRSFDLQKGGFVGDGERPVTPLPADGVQVANGSLTCVDHQGNLWVAYSVGQDGPGGGKLVIAFAQRDALSVWKQIDVAADAPMLGGNYSYSNFTISHGSGNQVVVFWSLHAEQHSKLYQRVFDAGEAIGVAKVVREGEPGEFRTLSGHRSLGFVTGLQLVVGSATQAAPDGEVKVYGMFPASAAWVPR